MESTIKLIIAIDCEDLVSSQLSPEQYLWGEVIARAVHDALRPSDLLGWTVEKVQRSAINYIFRKPTERHRHETDFLFACSAISEDPEYLMLKIQAFVREELKKPIDERLYNGFHIVRYGTLH